jgi:hypothetical protein
MNTNLSGPKLFTIVLSKEHGYAAGVALSSWLVLQYMGVNVMKARKRWDFLWRISIFKKMGLIFFCFRYNVDYPALYASDSNAQGKAFNCKFEYFLLLLNWIWIYRCSTWTSKYIRKLSTISSHVRFRIN